MSRSKSQWSNTAILERSTIKKQSKINRYKSKKLILLLFVLCISCLVIQTELTAQIPSSQGTSTPIVEENYYEIVARYENYISSLPPDSINHEIKVFERFRAFWEDRVNSGETGTPGTFSEYFQALSEYEDYNCEGISDNPEPWELIGPLEYDLHTMGIVKTVWMDSSNPDIVFAGTRSSGLWKTTNATDDGQQVWYNVLDQNNLVGFGVFDIAVSNINTNVMYITVGIDGGFTDGKYGNGILRSTDAGESWTVLSALADAVGDAGLDPFNTVFKSICIDPINNLNIYAGTKNKIFKSDDGGLSWNGINYTPPVTTNNKLTFRELEFSPDQTTLFAASENGSSKGGGAELWRMINSQWTNLTPNIEAAIVNPITNTIIDNISPPIWEGYSILQNEWNYIGNNTAIIHPTTTDQYITTIDNNDDDNFEMWAPAGAI